jgi:hypothetical protein
MYGLVGDNIVAISYSMDPISTSGAWQQIGYSETARYHLTGIPGYSYSIDDMTAIYLNVRDNHGNFVATVNVPYSNIKPIWHLQTDYTCHDPAGTDTSGVQDGGTFDNPNAAPTDAPPVICPSGSYVSSWHTHVTGPDGDHALLNWDAPTALTDPNGTYASCLKLAGGSACDLERHAPTQVGQPETCTWGTYAVALSDCDFETVLGSWASRTRIQAYGEFLPTVDASGELFTAVDQCLVIATVDQCKTMPIFRSYSGGQGGALIGAEFRVLRG